jgi:NAD(P)-dependent dehydrogenase (short-subunit alcohol dehydrogenase family)
LVPGGVEDGDGRVGQAVQHAVDAGGDVPCAAGHDGLVGWTVEIDHPSSRQGVAADQPRVSRVVSAQVPPRTHALTTRGASRGRANYSRAKAELQGFTEALAIELGRFGITVNCIAPGFIVSDMTRVTAERIGQDWDTYLATAIAEIPASRAGQPEDIAHAVSFFVGEAAGFVSGQVLYVAGGPRA